jgi:hypothetical protein
MQDNIQINIQKNYQDQRNSLKNKGTIDFDYLKNNFDQDNFDKRDFGNKIKLLSKSFNTRFIDQIDLENYKNFVNTIYQISYSDIKNSYKLGRKLFKDYKIHDICLDNIDFLGKEYLCYLYSDIIQMMFTNSPGGMQPHRDIIDMCKKGYEKTGYIECYYYLANLINGMCTCCFKPSNADQTAWKYYQKCLESGYENYSLHNDLIKISYNLILDNNNFSEEKEKYFNQMISSWDYLLVNFDDDKQFNFQKRLIIDNLIESSIILKKKDYLDNFLNNYFENFLDSLFITEILCFYYDYPGEYDKLVELCKTNMKPDKFNKIMLWVNFKLNKYSDMFTNINFLLEFNYDKKNKLSRITDDKIICFFLDNLDKFDNNILLKLIDYYFKISYHDWKIFFILFFDKLLGLDVDTQYIIDKIVLFDVDNSGCTYLIRDFNKNDTQIAKAFSDGLVNIIEYLTNNNNKLTKDSKQISCFINFLSKINPYCDYSNSDNNKYTNPFGTANLDEINIYHKVEDDKHDVWNIVTGEDSDYDSVYPTYSDYYNGLYKIKKNSQELDNKITQINQYIQENINLIKNKFDNSF